MDCTFSSKSDFASFVSQNCIFRIMNRRNIRPEQARAVDKRQHSFSKLSLDIYIGNIFLNLQSYLNDVGFARRPHEHILGEFEHVLQARPICFYGNVRSPELTFLELSFCFCYVSPKVTRNHSINGGFRIPSDFAIAECDRSGFSTYSCKINSRRCS